MDQMDPIAWPRSLALALFASATALGGCAAQSPAPDQPAAAGTPDVDSSAMVATAFGKGTYSAGSGSAVTFVFDAELTGGGVASGFFRHHGTYADGTVNLSAQVSCVGFDHKLGRAWIAGTVSANGSSAAGVDAGVLPTGSFVGFAVEDASVADTERLSFPSRLTGQSADAARTYCEARKWPRSGTHALTAGTLGVFP